METLPHSQRWNFQIIEPLKPSTIFDWGITDEYMWAAYKTMNGWVAKSSKDDGFGWNVKKTAVMGDVLPAETALVLIGGGEGMLNSYTV